jgi:hypothetical protein
VAGRMITLKHLLRGTLSVGTCLCTKYPYCGPRVITRIRTTCTCILYYSATSIIRTPLSKAPAVILDK